MANMTAKDRLVLARWIRSGATLGQVEDTASVGIVGNKRFTPAAVRAYKLVWLWCSHRFGGEMGRRQQRAYNRLGKDRFQRRLERGRRWAARLAGDSL